MKMIQRANANTKSKAWDISRCFSKAWLDYIKTFNLGTIYQHRSWWLVLDDGGIFLNSMR